MRSYTIEDMQELAESKGGKCLSDTYVKNSYDLQWECSEGHKWKAKPKDVINNVWCKRCEFQKISTTIKLIFPFVHKEIFEPGFEIGRACIKTHGKESGQICVIINIVDDTTVVIDGFSHPRECNIKHLFQTDFALDNSALTSPIELNDVILSLCKLNRVVTRRTCSTDSSPINNQQSTINNQQSTINNQQSTINNQQSTKLIKEYKDRIT